MVKGKWVMRYRSKECLWGRGGVRMSKTVRGKVGEGGHETERGWVSYWSKSPVLLRQLWPEVSSVFIGVRNGLCGKVWSVIVMEPLSPLHHLPHTPLSCSPNLYPHPFPLPFPSPLFPKTPDHSLKPPYNPETLFLFLFPILVENIRRIPERWQNKMIFFTGVCSYPADV